jgi:hypothetical protein
VSAPTVLAAPFGLPDPFGFVGGLVDGLLDVGGGVLGNVVEDAVRWLVDATLGALVDLATAILGFFWDAAEPDVAAGWFAGGRSTPYGEMVILAAPLLVGFFLAGIIQGVVRGDTAGMLHMAVVRLPGAVLAMTVVIAITDVLLRATDEMSDTVLGGFRDDVEATTRLLGQVAATPGLSGAGQLLLLAFGGVGLLAAVVLVIELFVRAGLIYIVVALSPLIYAAAAWEQLRSGVRKLAELCLALIVSKFVIAVALSLSAAALVAAWPGDTGGEIATPELAAGTGSGPDGGGVAQTVGLLVGAVVMFGVAAFMPFVLFRLLPIAEGALVSQGIKAGPMRAAQQAHHTALIARHNPATAATRRYRHHAGGTAAHASGSAAGSGASAVGSGAGAGAAAGPAGAVVGAAASAGKAAAKAGVRRTAAAADHATAAAGSASPSGSASPGASKGAVRQVRWGATGPGAGHTPPGSATPTPSSTAQRRPPPQRRRSGPGGDRR